MAGHSGATPAAADGLGSPITAVNRVLRGRSPPASMVLVMKEFLEYRDCATPQVTEKVVGSLRTAMSPEEGALSPTACQQAIVSLVGIVKTRRSNRIAAQKKLQDDKQRAHIERCITMGEARRAHREERAEAKARRLPKRGEWLGADNHGRRVRMPPSAPRSRRV